MNNYNLKRKMCYAIAVVVVSMGLVYLKQIEFLYVLNEYIGNTGINVIEIIVLISVLIVILLIVILKSYDRLNEFIGYVKINKFNYIIISSVTLLCVLIINRGIIVFLGKVGIELINHKINFFNTIFTVIIVEILFKFTRRIELKNTIERFDWRLYYLSVFTMETLTLIFKDEVVNEIFELANKEELNLNYNKIKELYEDSWSSKNINTNIIGKKAYWDEMQLIKFKIGYQIQKTRRSWLISFINKLGIKVGNILITYSNVMDDDITCNLHNLQALCSLYDFSVNEPFENYDDKRLFEYIVKIVREVLKLNKRFVNRYKSKFYFNMEVGFKAKSGLVKARLRNEYSIDEFCTQLAKVRKIALDSDEDIKKNEIFYRLIELQVIHISEDEAKNICSILEQCDKDAVNQSILKKYFESY